MTSFQVIDDVIPHVPVGRANAKTSRDIWKAVGCWSPVGVRHALNELVETRAVASERDPIPSGFRWVFWKEALVLLALIIVTSPTIAGESETIYASTDDGKPTIYDGANYHGRTATGRFDARLLGLAHISLPLRSCVGLAYRDRVVPKATILDRGPCRSRRCQATAPADVKRRKADLWPRVARLLRFPGLGNVKIWRVKC